MASGKSTVGRLVAARTGAPYHDLDEMIEARCGTTIAELFASRGEDAFRALEAAVLPEALEPGAVAALGGGTPMRDESWRVIRQRAVTVWLDAPLPTLVDRAGPPGSRPLLNGRSATELQALLTSRLPRYGEADHRVDGAGPADEVAEEVIRLWRG